MRRNVKSIRQNLSSKALWPDHLRGLARTLYHGSLTEAVPAISVLHDALIDLGLHHTAAFINPARVGSLNRAVGIAQVIRWGYIGMSNIIGHLPPAVVTELQNFMSNSGTKAFDTELVVRLARDRARGPLIDYLLDNWNSGNPNPSIAHPRDEDLMAAWADCLIAVAAYDSTLRRGIENWRSYYTKSYSAKAFDPNRALDLAAAGARDPLIDYLQESMTIDLETDRVTSYHNDLEAAMDWADHLIRAVQQGIDYSETAEQAVQRWQAFYCK